MKINKHLDNLSECHNATVQKIAKIINFWSRFYLSLPGRINIAKTLILSQISYLGCIITPTRETLQHITTQINNFIVGGLNIAKDRICRPTELGGLGMIDLEDFITAQQVTWFKRAYISTRDNWRVDLKKIGNGNVLTVGEAHIDPVLFPIFTYLSKSLQSFLKAFNMTNNNLSKSFILNNPLLHISRDLKRPLDFNFFRTTLPHQDLDLVCKITLDQIAGNGRLLSMDDISANTGTGLNINYLSI